MNPIFLATVLGGLIAGGVTLSATSIRIESRRNLFARVSATAPGIEFRRKKSQRDTKQKPTISKRANSTKIAQIDAELAPLLELLITAVAAGESLFGAMQSVANRASGLVASCFDSAVTALQLGSSLEDELNEIARQLPSTQVLELCNKMALSINRGTPLAAMLRQQVLTARANYRNQLLKQAGVNETRMLIPLVFMVLPVTVLFAIYPSIQLLQVANQ